MWYHIIMDTNHKFRVTTEEGYRSVPTRYSTAKEIADYLYHEESEIEFVD